MRRTTIATSTLCAALLALAGAPPASAAVRTASAPTTRVTVSGSTATATAAFTATPSVTATLAGTCMRDAAGRDRDFALHENVRLTSSAVTVTATQQLTAGTYSAWPCALVEGSWLTLAAAQRVVVPGQSTPAPTPTPPPAKPTPPSTGATASGQAMPTAPLPGWKQVFADDFTTPVATGGFPGPAYADRWTGYSGFTDTSGVGTYTPSKVVSVRDGALDMHLRTEGGKALTAAPVPLVDGRWGGWTYGRYSVRFRADPVAGYKTAWLLWPDSENWNDGEIDFPEGELDGTVNGFVHRPGNPAENALAVSTGVSYSGWHTATVEWLPTGVTFLLDGRQVGRTTVSPNRPMHLVLQTETSGRPPASAAGHVQIDWITMHERS